jgi:hypothetical protein
MNSHAEGFIAPCICGGKEKTMAYVLYSDGIDDIVIPLHCLPVEVVANGGRMRVSGELCYNKEVKHMSVDHYTVLS